MSYEDTFDKIRELGQKRDIKGLQSFTSKIDIKEIISHIQSNINNPNVTYTLNYILQSFTDTPESHKNRALLVSAILKELSNNDVNTSRINAIVHRLCMELAKFKSEDLIELCDYCLDSIQNKTTTNMNWKDLLPELLNVLSEREVVLHNDVEITGIEYKNQYINSLCMIQWNPNIVTTLTSMFVDMPLTKDEHLQVVNKLGQFMESLTPQEIPAFVYQLLRLCKESNSRSIFLRLQNYFSLRIYSSPGNDQDSNSESTVDLIESCDERDVIETESTVLFHIHSAASLGHESIKDYLSSLKNTLKSPEFILHPFQLTVLLTISTLPHYEERVFEILRMSVSRTYHEEQKKISSLWFREMASDTCQVEVAFKKVINLTTIERELVLQGLVNFAFILLGVGSLLGRDLVAEKQWQLGNMILLKVIKRKRTFAPTIIQNLSNRIVTGQNVTQYIECMYILSRSLPLLMLENQSCVVELMECLLQMPAVASNQLLDAIMPLTKVSPTIRDHIILLLRKALYSKVTETRQMAVNGFLKLLTNLKIANMAVLSQTTSGSFSSGHSLFTQISLSRAGATQCRPSVFSNEALCLEMLGILQRCLMQQAEVRGKLYEGLYRAVCMNPELSIPVLDVLWTHFNNFYVLDEAVLPPLKFNKITASKDIDVSLQEPLGKLIYSISLIVTKVSESDNENDTVVKFHKVLSSLSSRMTNCELMHLELDDGTDLLDVLPESQEKLLILKEALSVYEALIGYKISSWGPESENIAQEINSLNQGYARLVNFSKNLTRPKKSERKKKSDADKSTQPDVSDSVAKKGKDKSQKGRTFKVPDTVLDFHTVVRALRLLYDKTTDWASMREANLIRTKADLHRHFVQAAIHLVHSLKWRKFVDSESSKLCYDYLVEIGRIVYKFCVLKFQDLIDFDSCVAVLAAECFYNVLNVVCLQFDSNLTSFLNKLGDVEEEKFDIVKVLTPVMVTYQKLFEIEKDEEDAELKKVDLIVINTLTLLAEQIPSDNNPLSLQLLDWLKNMANNNPLNGKQVVSAFVALIFDTHIKFKVGLSLFENMSVSLGNSIGLINEDDKQSEEFTIINENSVQSILLCLCSSIKSLLEDVDWLILRLRSEYSVINYPGIENVDRRKEVLKTKEKGISCHLCFIVTIVSHLSNITVPPGNISESILKNLSHIFCTLNSLTRYFTVRSSKSNAVFQGARFEHLVKLAGKQLAPVVYRFILYIEEAQRQNDDVSPSKRKRADSAALKNKVLKETRLIPKVVYELEQFSKSVTQLSTKTKVDLTRWVGQGTVRDFRIMHLKEVLERAGGGANETTVVSTQGDDEGGGDETNAGGDETNAGGDETNAEGGEQSPDDVFVESEEENMSPPVKKFRF